MNGEVQLQDGDALVIVDVQNDFVSGGALAVPHGEDVIPVLNRYISLFEKHSLPIFATRDWHPENHCSFKMFGGRWPVHCVVGTPGGQIVSTLQLPNRASVISKPSAPDFETFSPFPGTDFENKLRRAQVRRLFVGGLATDYCVLHTSLDAIRHGFEVFLLKDAVRAVNVRINDGEAAEQKLMSAGAKLVMFDRIHS